VASSVVARRRGGDDEKALRADAATDGNGRREAYLRADRLARAVAATARAVRAGGDKDCGNSEDEGGRGRGKAWASNRAAMVPGVCGQGLFTCVGVEGRRGSGCASPVPSCLRW
jgi:hypothetical protein